MKAWVADHSEKIVEYRDRHKNKDISAFREYHAKYRSENKEKIKSDMREYQKDNAAILSEKKKAYAAANVDLIRKQQAESHFKNRDARRESQREYVKSNRHIFNAKNSRRRAAKLQSIPSWFGEFDAFVLSEAHKLTSLRESMFGFKWHVDHIVPLQGKTVCGLHIHNNIAVIPAIDNIRKKNRYD